MHEFSWCTYHIPRDILYAWIFMMYVSYSTGYTLSMNFHDVRIIFHGIYSMHEFSWCTYHIPRDILYAWIFTGIQVLIEIMACRPFSAMTLPEPVLRYWQLNHREWMPVTFQSDRTHFLSKKCSQNVVCQMEAFLRMMHIFNTLRPRRNGQHFPDDDFKRVFSNENIWISIKISLKFIPKGPIKNIPALVQIMDLVPSHYLNQW